MLNDSVFVLEAGMQSFSVQRDFTLSRCDRNELQNQYESHNDTRNHAIKNQLVPLYYYSVSMMTVALSSKELAGM